VISYQHSIVTANCGSVLQALHQCTYYQQGRPIGRKSWFLYTPPAVDFATPVVDDAVGISERVLRLISREPERWGYEVEEFRRYVKPFWYRQTDRRRACASMHGSARM